MRSQLRGMGVCVASKKTQLTLLNSVVVESALRSRQSRPRKRSSFSNRSGVVSSPKGHRFPHRQRKMNGYGIPNGELRNRVLTLRSVPKPYPTSKRVEGGFDGDLGDESYNSKGRDKRLA